jgi:uncharacterized membrane protein
MSGEVRRFGLILGLLLAISVAASFRTYGLCRIVLQVVCCLLATGYSYYIIKNTTTLMSELRERIKNKRRRLP